MRRNDETGFDSHIHDICSDEVTRMLRHCRLNLPEIDGRRLLAHLAWILFRYYESYGPQEAADGLEKGAMHAMYQLAGFSPCEIDAALEAATQTVEDIVANKPRQKAGPMRRTRWHGGSVVAFPKDKRQDQSRQSAEEDG